MDVFKQSVQNSANEVKMRLIASETAEIIVLVMEILTLFRELDHLARLSSAIRTDIFNSQMALRLVPNMAFIILTYDWYVCINVT